MSSDKLSNTANNNTISMLYDTPKKRGLESNQSSNEQWLTVMVTVAVLVEGNGERKRKKRRRRVERRQTGRVKSGPG